MEIKKNTEFEIKITDMSDDGSGIGKTDGFTWFVKDAVIGDRVIASAMKLKKSYGFARLIRVIEPSPKRCTPPCPVARACGGCQLQQLEYGAQLHFKEQKVLNDLRRIGGFDIQSIEPIMGMEEPFRYRNKAVYPIGRGRDGRIIAGFYAGRTHSIIECEDCLLGCTDNKAILEEIISFMEKENIEPYDETSGKGTVRHVLIRKGHNTGQIMVCIVIDADDLKKKELLSEGLREKVFGLTSFSLCVNKKNTNVIMGDRIINVFGPGYIEDVIYERKRAEEASAADAYIWEDACAQENIDAENGVRFRISPLSFFQVNSVQMERLYSTALEFAGLTGNENVWDLYCGVGTISLFLARHAKRVYGVEIIPDAIENARENAAINGIENAEFFVGKAEEVLPEWYENEYKAEGDNNMDNAVVTAAAASVHDIDVIVVDPPRKGCDEMCLKTMVSIAPKRIVYVSCDPATLARDLKYLCENGYELMRVRPCDMFPQTVHVETVVLMSRKDK